MKPFKSLFFSCIILTISFSVQAGWNDFFKEIFTEENKSTASQAISGLSQSDIVSGLKQALSQGTDKAILSLGKTNGFLGNPTVKIPMPPQLQTVESALRKIKQDKLADEFVLTMNRAAESAVNETKPILFDAIKQMTFADAKSILNGPDDAATQYFQKTSRDHLSDKISPIVKEATTRTGVTRTYKDLFDQLGFMSNFIDMESLDLDRYVTDKTVDGLFTLLAEEEKLIRTEPTARTSELLKKVFAN